MFPSQQRAAAILGVAGLALAPALSHLTNSWLGFPLFAFIFFGFTSSLLAWGHWISRRLEASAAHAFLFSSLIAVALMAALGHLSLVGAGLRWPLLAFLFAGLFLPGSREVPALFRLGEGRWPWAVLAFLVGLRIFSAYLPQAHGDPLLYHLMAPRLWNLDGRITLHADLPIAFLASAWEYFFLWPQILFAGPAASVNDLVLAQIFSQWIHFTWGLVGSFYVLRHIWRRAVPGASFAYLLPFFFVVSMQWTAPLAKNDCGVAFWCLGAWLLLSGEKRSHWLLGGVFAGLAVAAKINAILFLIPLAALLLGKAGYSIAKKQSKIPPQATLFLMAILGCILGAGPIYLRNWLETANPFFTMFAHIFPSAWISQSWADHFSAHQPAKEFLLMFRVKQLLKESPVFFLYALLPLAFFLPSARAALRRSWEWMALFLLSFLLCIVAIGSDAEIRYMGASLWIGAISISYLFIEGLSQWPKVRRVALPLFVIGILAASKLPTHLLWKFPKTATGEAMVRQHTAGEAKKWIRDNVPANKLVVINGDNETYYLSTNRVTILTENPAIDAATYKIKELPAFLRGLCKASGAGYLLDARLNASLGVRFPSEVWKDAILFEHGGAQIYDLKKLARTVLGSEEGCGTQ